MKLEIIIASTRPGRIGKQIGDWFAPFAASHSDFDVAVADLAYIDLPMFDEPNHPMRGEYTKDHTKAWSARVAAADAFVIITPEYNYTMPPALVNAMDYLHHEWKYKPVGFVGYGGAGAARAIQTEKLLVTTLSMMPVMPSVTLMGVYAPGIETFVPEDKHEAVAATMLAELTKWAEALQSLHTD